MADSSTAWSGSLSARIQSLAARPEPAGASLCQAISAANYRGRKVEFSMHLRSNAATPGSHLWLRIDGADGRMLAFDGMAGRWLEYSQDWARHAVVIEVPEQAAAIIIGAALVNTGTLWVDDASLRVVDRNLPVTQQPVARVVYNEVVDASQLPPALRNPGLEQTVPAR